MIIENLNFYFLLKSAFYLDHTFPRREELGRSEDVSYPPYFLVSKLAWSGEERKNLPSMEYLLYVRADFNMLKKKIHYVKMVSFYLHALPPPNPYLQANYEKNIRQISIKGHSTKYLSNASQIYQGLQTHRGLRNHHC